LAPNEKDDLIIFNNATALAIRISPFEGKFLQLLSKIVKNKLKGRQKIYNLKKLI